MTKINRVAVLVEDNMARITLYKTNTKIAEIWNCDIEVPDLDLCGEDITKTTYQQYCRDVVINLLQNGGIADMYYEEKQSTDGASKYGTSAFVSAIQQRISDIFDDMFEDTDYEYTINSTNSETKVIDRYKGDNNIKNATVDIDVRLTKDTTKLAVSITGEIKSGQICKPKHMLYNGEQYTINLQNVKRLFKQN